MVISAFGMRSARSRAVAAVPKRSSSQDRISVGAAIPFCRNLKRHDERKSEHQNSKRVLD